MGKNELPPINFTALADALLRDADNLVPRWLPGGDRRGHEYVCGSLAGGKGSSFSVNLVSGKWADFASDEKGNDLLSLYAAIHNLSQGKAAADVAREEGLEDVAGIVMGADPAAPPKPPRPAPPPARPKPEPEGWATVVPVPSTAMEPIFKHFHRQPGDIEHKAVYQVGDELHGFVVRFRTSDGGKDTLPYTWCQSARDGAAKWNWRQWDEPRPLFFPGKQLPEGRTVILVEGERKGECLQALMDAGAPGVYCVVSWPGGSKAWQKANWALLAGCTVIAWPDCDSKREPLTAAERNSCASDAEREAAQAAKPLLPVEKQPGMKAMLGIGSLLRETHSCTVQLLPIPKPGVVVDGWDARDAIETDGWDFERVQAFLAQAYALPATGVEPEPAADAGGKGGGKKRDPLGGTGASDDAPGGDDDFADYLRFIAKQIGVDVWALQPNRKMIVAALRKSPSLNECLAFDELRGAPVTRKAWPWRAEPAPLVDQDDVRLADYIEQTYKVKSPSRAAVAEAIEVVADERRFHPIKEWLKGLEWDGKPRLEKWLIHVLGHDPAALEPKLKRYLELVGRYIMLGHVYRVMEPGCKFDYSVVLEGLTGMRKSTMVKTLVGEPFFSDTHFDIGSGKDGMEQLAGIWAYELSEMTAFRRADSEAVKQFFSTSKDRYRGAYGRYVQDHPRQVVIWCTTNKRQYLFDVTGNRRFWPLWVGQAINIAWLEKWRAQLFAEAFAMWKQGERNYPSQDEERLYFKPEQEKRLVETGVQSRLFDLLTRPGSPSMEVKGAAAMCQHTAFVTVAELVTALGTDPGKSSALLETQIRDWLMENGWTPRREPGGQRRRGYARPAVWPPEFADEVDEQPTTPAPVGAAGAVSTPPAAEWAFVEGKDDEPF